MTTSKFEFEKLVKLLGRSEKDQSTASFFGQAISNIKHDEYCGSLEFKSEGVDVVFQEAPWVIPSEQIYDPKELYLAAFHLHSSGHEGYQGYSGELPSALAFGDSDAEVLRKMGQPIKTGGGMSRFIGAISRWSWYPIDDAILHLQFNSQGRVEMVTLRVPDVKTGIKVAEIGGVLGDSLPG